MCQKEKIQISLIGYFGDTKKSVQNNNILTISMYVHM